MVSSFLYLLSIHTQEENCKRLKLFPRGSWDGIVSAAPAQANIDFPILYLDNHSA